MSLLRKRRIGKGYIMKHLGGERERGISSVNIYWYVQIELRSTTKQLHNIDKLTTQVHTDLQ